jgi:YesN/AraC family two-component response regulator
MKRSLLAIIFLKIVRSTICSLENLLNDWELNEANRSLLSNEVPPDVEIVIKERDVLSEIVQRADKVMEEKRLYLDPNFTLEALAKEVWSNRTYVSKALRLKRGVSFREYVYNFRLGYARKLWSNEECGAKDMAIMSGFNDVRTFNRAADDFLL